MRNKNKWGGSSNNLFGMNKMYAFNSLRRLRDVRNEMPQRRFIRLRKTNKTSWTILILRMNFNNSFLRRRSLNLIAWRTPPPPKN